MASIGVVRKLDALGRIVIPIEIRRALNIEESDAMEIFVDKEKLILRKFQTAQSCVFCGEIDNTVVFNEKYVCKKCLEKLTNQSGILSSTK